MARRNNRNRNRRPVNEDTVGWSVMKRPSPFKIGTAPPPVMDASTQMNAIYLQRRAEEAATFNEQLRLVGQMDKLEGLFTTLFRDIVETRNFIELQHSEPLLTKKHTAVMGKMINILDKLASTVGEDLVPLCDELVVDRKEDPFGLMQGDDDEVDDDDTEEENDGDIKISGMKQRFSDEEEDPEEGWH